jgi:hypothetical protein
MKKLRLLVPLAVVVTLLLLLIAPAGALAAPEKHGGGGGCARWHYVRCGQTLSGIARMYGTSVSYLTALNHLRNPNKIYAGTYLCVRSCYPVHPPKHGHQGPC